MIQLSFTKNDIIAANNLANKLGQLNNSITNGGGNFSGFLGELVLARYLNIEFNEKRNVYNHDLIYLGKTIEVKTKRRTQDPSLYWDVSVASTSLHQRPDIYAFMSITFKEFKKTSGQRVYDEPLKIWLCGFYDAKKYVDEAQFIRKGSLDPSNNFRAHVDMYNLKISKLQNKP